MLSPNRKSTHQDEHLLPADEYALSKQNLRYLKQKVDEIEQVCQKYSGEDFTKLKQTQLAEQMRENMGLDDQTYVRSYKEMKKQQICRAKKNAFKSLERDKINELKALQDFERNTRQIMNLVDMQIRVKILNADSGELEDFQRLHGNLKLLKQRLDNLPLNRIDQNKLGILKMMFKK